MSLIPIDRELTAFVKIDGSEERVDFSQLSIQEFFRNDIVRSRITGLIPKAPNLSLANFIESILHDIAAEQVDFGECDFKDSLVKSAVFEHCSFNNTTFATSFFSDCIFSDCTFYNAAIHSSEFHRTKFHHCDLKNLLIKSSRFVDCELASCATSNKLMEMSTLDKTRFISMEIQLQTITGNFGLTVENLSDVKIRSGRIREDHNHIDLDEMWNELQKDRWSPLEKLRIEYFLRPNLTKGSQHLDRALDLTQWTQIYKNPGSFVELLEGFSEFVTHLYTGGRLTAHSVLLFHYVTSRLTEMLPQKDDLHRLAMSLGGTHMVLSRIVEEYLDTLKLLSDRDSNNVTFLVEGPLDKSYYSRELAPWFNPEVMHIDFLVEHNSPLELGITAQPPYLAILIAVFLATRTKFEIISIRERFLPKNEEEKERGIRFALQQPQEGDQALSLRSDLMTQDERQYDIRARSLLPGSLLADLNLQVSTEIAGKVRGIIKDLFS